MELNKLVHLEDIGRLPKEVLEELCDGLEIPDNADPFDLANIIYKEFQTSDGPKRNAIFNNVQDVVYAGRRAVTWFTIPDDLGIVDMPNAFYERAGIKPYENIIPRSPDAVGKSALIVGACDLGQNRHLIRMLVGSGATRFPYDGAYRTQPISTLTNVMVDFNEKFIEIRSDPKYNKRILKVLADIMGLEAKSINGIIKPVDPNKNKIDELADGLGGAVFKYDSKPDKMLKQQMTEEQVAATASILISMDEYFEEQDLTILEEKLLSNYHKMGSLTDLPFSLVLLAGLEKFGISVNEINDIKFQPLLVALKPHLESLGGFIRFPVNEKGIETYHTIRIGLTTKSVSFRTYATESSIETVRKVILEQD